MNALRDHLSAELRRLAYVGARHGPEWWLRWSPGAFGVLACALASQPRRAVRNKLGWVLGRPPSAREVYSTFSNFAHCLAESLGSEQRDVLLEVHGAEHVETALSRGRGAILLTAHTGAWELVASRFARALRREIIVVMEAESSVRARAVHEKVRTQGGVRTVYVGENPFSGLGLVSELADGAVVAFQLDRTPRSGRALDTRLFGRRFAVPEGPFRLAQATGAPLVSVFCDRLGFLAHRLRAGPPCFLFRNATAAPGAFAPSTAALHTTVPSAAAQFMVSQFEAFLDGAPDQWFGFESTPFERP